MTKKPNVVKTQFSTSSSNKSIDSSLLITSITDALLEKKAKNVVLLDVSQLTTLTDYFVVCHGTSDTQIKALADNVEDQTRIKVGEKPWKKEGMDSRRWIILDFINIVVHIFNEEKREYYGIERMWNDAVRTEIEDE
ncbi:MAG: ribosome silencing factor [Balneolaceae bacterium]